MRYWAIGSIYIGRYKITTTNLCNFGKTKDKNENSSRSCRESRERIIEMDADGELYEPPDL
jgi:hypothetical protein